MLHVEFFTYKKDKFDYPHGAFWLKNGSGLTLNILELSSQFPVQSVMRSCLLILPLKQMVIHRVYIQVYGCSIGFP